MYVKEIFAILEFIINVEAETGRNDKTWYTSFHLHLHLNRIFNFLKDGFVDVLCLVVTMASI